MQLPATGYVKARVPLHMQGVGGHVYVAVIGLVAASVPPAKATRRPCRGDAMQGVGQPARLPREGLDVVVTGQQRGPLPVGGLTSKGLTGQQVKGLDVG